MMMPSRGLVSAASVARQAVRTNRRFISTTSSRNIHTALRQPLASGLLHNTASWRSGRIAGASAASLFAQSRLASTSAPAANAAAGADAAAATATAAAPTPGPLDNAAAEATSAFDISNISDTYLTGIPERIGYLKEIGLDYGWGPTAMVEWALEHIHVYTGLPWWSSIVATALCFRVVMLPLFKKSSDVGARQQAMLPITKPLNAKMMEAMKANDMETMSKMRAELQAINKRAGISVSSMLAPALIQGVFGFCAFRLMRAMANLPVPGLENGGILWFTDLTQADPYMALPAIMAISMHVVFRFGGESGAPMANPAMKPIMLYAMPVLIFISTIWMPANLDLWLATTGVTGIAQVTLFRQPGVRKALGMAPLVPNDPRNPNHPTSTSNSNSKTINVKGTSRPSSADAGYMRYQAPNLKTTATAGASAASEAEAPKSDIISRAKEGLNRNMNNVSEGMKSLQENTAAKLAQMSGQKQKASKTRSTDFLKQAEEYERRWQKTHGGKKGQ